MTTALVYEWRRITSIRSTYVLALSFLAATAAVAYLIFQMSQQGFVQEDGTLAPAAPVQLGTVIVAGTNFLSAIFLTTIAAQSFGHEYRYGMIRLTLSEFPRRWQVFAAKLLMVLAWVVVLFALSIAVAILVLKLTGASVDTVDSQTWGQVGRAALYLVGYCAIAFALTVVTRNLVLGVVIPLLLGAVVEPLAAAGLADRLPWLPQWLPISAGTRFVDGAADAAGAAGAQAMAPGGLVFLAWVVALLVVAYLLLDRRDA